MSLRALILSWIEGWLANNSPMLPAIPKPLTAGGSSSVGTEPSLANALIIGVVLLHDLCSACVSSELSMAREVSNNNSRQNPQNNIQHDGCNVITDSGASLSLRRTALSTKFPIILERNTTNVFVTPWNKSQSNHITVGNVSNFMSEHCFYFFFIHAGRRPVETATMALLRDAPVAKALASPS